MTRDDDFIGQLEGYLEEFEGITPLPDGIRNAVRAQLPRTNQIGPVSGLMRYLTLNRPIKIALAAAAAVVLALVGYGLFAGGNVGHQPSQSLSGTPSPSPTPIRSPVSFPDPGVSNKSIPAGRVVVDGAFPIKVSFDAPVGWVATDLTTGRASLQKGPVEVNFVIVDDVSADPCRASGWLSPPLGPTVDEFVTAITDWPGFQTTNLRDIRLGGMAGKALTLTNHIDMATCDSQAGLVQLSHAHGSDVGIFAILGDQEERFWVLDVDGTRLVVLVVSTSGDETQTELSDAIGIVGSIRFE